MHPICCFHFIQNKTMAHNSLITFLNDWFRHYTPVLHRSNNSSTSRIDYTTIYPEIKSYHRQQSNLFFCIPFIRKTKTDKRNSSIKGCASFARFGRYKEGDNDDDC